MVNLIELTSYFLKELSFLFLLRLLMPTKILIEVSYFYYSIVSSKVGLTILRLKLLKKVRNRLFSLKKNIY